MLSVRTDCRSPQICRNRTEKGTCRHHGDTYQHNLKANTLASERLRRSPDLLYSVANALRAFATEYNKSFRAAKPREHPAKEGEASENQTCSYEVVKVLRLHLHLPRLHIRNLSPLLPRSQHRKP